MFSKSLPRLNVDVDVHNVKRLALLHFIMKYLVAKVQNPRVARKKSLIITKCLCAYAFEVLKVNGIIFILKLSNL